MLVKVPVRKKRLIKKMMCRTHNVSLLCLFTLVIKYNCGSFDTVSDYLIKNTFKCSTEQIMFKVPESQATHGLVVLREAIRLLVQWSLYTSPIFAD
jgi:hypothetical protein